jgi:hypothetical protein
VRKFPVAPLIDGGKGRLTIISISDLTSSLVQLLENPRPGCFRLYNKEQVTFKELLVEVKRTGGFKTILVPVSGQIIYAGLWMTDKLRLPIQMDSGNLKGFQANQSVQDPSDLPQFVSQPAALTEMVRMALDQSSH